MNASSTRRGILCLAAGLALLSCSDVTLMEPLPQPEEPVTKLTLLDCTVQADEPSMTCTPGTSGSIGFGLAAIQLGSPYVSLRSTFTGRTSDRLRILSYVELTNSSGQRIGEIAASRVWFYTLPEVTGGSGEVTVNNPDGTDTFIDSEPRPFFRYIGVLDPDETSATKNWWFDLSSTVTAFQFSVFVEVSMADENAPLIRSISPDRFATGDELVITGTRFGATIGENQVTIDGMPVTVLAATTSELTVAVPGAAQCTVGDFVVEVTVGARPPAKRSHPGAMGPAKTLSALAVGEHANLHLPADVGCGFELPVADGEQYFLSVHNVATHRLDTDALRVVGSMAGVSAAPSVVHPVIAAERILVPEQQRQLEEQAAHIRALEQNRDLVLRLGPAPAVTAAATGANPPPAAGDTLYSMFGPAAGTFIDARVVYSGTHAVVLEDILSPMADQMDAELISMGEEYDNLMHGLITTNFGDPLAYQTASHMSNNGVVYLLFARSAAMFSPGVVRSCDFYPVGTSAGQCSRSNEAEIAYIRAPLQEETETWLRVYHRTTRRIVIHEVKHVASMAEDFAASRPLEEAGLEEATASVSEELWGRAIHGTSQLGNMTWAEGPGCFSFHGAPYPTCGEPVSGTNPLFSALYDRLWNWEAHTQFGSPGYYYMYWLFVRWGVDHSGSAESALLKSLVANRTQLGIDNLTGKLGRPFPEMFGEFTLATMVDDLADFTPASAALTHPSWHTRDIYANLQGTTGMVHRTREFPILPTEVPFGAFQVDLSSVAAGSARIFQLTDSDATGGGTQVVRLRSLDGSSTADPRFRASIVRVQ
jgi:hypothetical protein